MSISESTLLETLPFIASIYLEMLSPLATARMRKTLTRIATAEGLAPEISAKVVAYAEYSSDASQIISGFFLTIVAALLLTLIRGDILTGILVVVTLVGMMLGVLYYIDILDPYRWSAKVIGRRIRYSWSALIGIALNVVIIVLVLL